jgi:DNA-directed RNA polymerase specialized sigma24 family protein
MFLCSKYLPMNIGSNYQDQLFPYAYNILGSVDDALDMIQDVIMKYIALDKKDLENEMGYLVKAVINQSINLKNSKNKQVIIQGWLPEPFATERADAGLHPAD